MTNPGAPGFTMSNALIKNAATVSPACECGDNNHGICGTPKNYPPLDSGGLQTRPDGRISKSEILISKNETNTKHEARNAKQIPNLKYSNSKLLRSRRI